MIGTLKRSSSQLSKRKRSSVSRTPPLIKLQSTKAVKESETSPQILRERQKKYKQIMKLINSYKRTSEDIENLQKIKKETKMEINLRFMNSGHNQSYKFPFLEQEQSDEQNQFEEGDNKDYTLFDLHTQTYLIPKSMSMKVLTLNDSKRRIKSLQKAQLQDNVLRREYRKPISGTSPTKLKNLPHFNEMIKNSHRRQEIIHMKRKNSLTDRKINLLAIRLPQLNTNLKGSKKKLNLGEVIGRKIVTEASPERVEGREKGQKLAKYLKNFQGSTRTRKLEQPKKFFLKQY